MLRDKIKKYAAGLSGNISNELEFSANFKIQNGHGKEQFHLVAQKGEMLLLDGESSHPYIVFESREQTIMEILELGDDLLDVLLAKPFYINLDQLDIPGLDITFFIGSETPQGTPIRYKMAVRDAVIHVWEGEEEEKDVSIRIKPSILRELIRGEINIPFALIRGQIRIRNKKEFFRALKFFGMNMN